MKECLKKSTKRTKQNILNKNKYQIHTITDLFWKKKSTKLILIKGRERTELEDRNENETGIKSRKQN